MTNHILKLIDIDNYYKCISILINPIYFYKRDDIIVIDNKFYRVVRLNHSIVHKLACDIQNIDVYLVEVQC